MKEKIKISTMSDLIRLPIKTTDRYGQTSWDVKVRVTQADWKIHSFSSHEEAYSFYIKKLLSLRDYMKQFK